jgi:hypothetical protein
VTLRTRIAHQSCRLLQYILFLILSAEPYGLLSQILYVSAASPLSDMHSNLISCCLCVADRDMRVIQVSQSDIYLCCFVLERKSLSD